MAQVKRFVTVCQRRVLQIDESVFPHVEHLYAIETHMSMEERSLLFYAATQLPPGFVACEIGSYVGASTCFLATAAKLRGGRLHCVDTWDNRAMGAEQPRDTYSEFLRNTSAHQNVLTIHRAEAASVVTSVPDGLALLFLDGDHSYEGTASNLRDYAPKVKPTGLLALHDYSYESVRKACDEHLAARAHRAVGSVASLQIFQLG